MKDITIYGNQKLSLIVNNDESLYTTFQNSSDFEGFITQYIDGIYTYTEEQLEELEDNFYKKNYIQEIQKAAKGNPLKQDIAIWIIEKGKEYEYMDGLFRDLEHIGCIGGFVSHLSDYKDTNDFYDKYEVEIWELLEEQTKIHGYSNPLELISRLKSSQNINDLTTFKNVLTWYVFEETVFNLIPNTKNKNG